MRIAARLHALALAVLSLATSAPAFAQDDGSLSPPAPMDTSARTPPPANDTAATLDESKKKDSGRGLEWVYLNAEGGFEQLGLKTFNVDRTNFTAGLVDTSSTGGVVGVGVGVRLVFLTLGARGRLGFFNNYQLYSLGGELGLHIPLGIVEPRIDLGFGWCGLGSVNSEFSGASDALNIHGLYGRIGGGLDVYLAKHFTLGAAVSWELLGLTRPGFSVDQINAIKAQGGKNLSNDAAAALAADGSSVGSALAVTGVVGLHF